MKESDKFSDIDSAIMVIMVIGGAFIFAIGASLANFIIVFIGVFMMISSPYPAILHSYLRGRKNSE